MSLAIVGVGIVSPLGLTVREHVFFARANVPPPAPSPFVTQEGERLRVLYCPWLGARDDSPARLGELAMPALEEAWAPLADLASGVEVKLAVITPHLGEGEAAPGGLSDLTRRLAARVGARDVEHASGDAAAFGVFERAAVSLGSGRPVLLVVVAVDSMINLARLTALVAKGPSPFAREPPPPSEGAACVVVTSAAFARRLGIEIIGRIERSATASAPSRDDNDEPTDGAAMTSVIGQIAGEESLGLVYGQSTVDDFRNQEWAFASARHAPRFGPAAEFLSVEDWAGRVGAAAGMMNVVFGLGALDHEATPWSQTPRSIVAWALSPDGLRGAALVARGRS